MIDRLDELLKNKDYVGVVEFLLSLSDEDRKKLLDVLRSNNVDVDGLLKYCLYVYAKHWFAEKQRKNLDELVEIANKVCGGKASREVLEVVIDTALTNWYNTMIGNPTLDEALSFVSYLEKYGEYLAEDRRREFYENVAKVLINVCDDAIMEGRYDDAKRALDVLKKVVAVLGSEALSKDLEKLEAKYEVLSDSKLREFIEAENRKDYVKALNILRSLSKEQLEKLRRFLELQNKNLDELVKALEWNAFVELTRNATSVEQVIEVARKVFGALPKQVEDLALLARLRELIKEGRYGEALKLIDEAKDDDVKRMILGVVIASAPPETLEKLMPKIIDYARRLGMRDVVEIGTRVNEYTSATAVVIDLVRKELANKLSEGMVNALIDVLKRGDDAEILRLAENEAIKNVDVNGVPLPDLLRSVVELKNCRKKFSELRSIVDAVSHALENVVDALRNGREPSVGIDPNMVDEGLKLVEELRSELDEFVKSYEKLVKASQASGTVRAQPIDVEKLRKSLNKVEELLKRAKGVYLALKGDLVDAKKIADELGKDSLIYAVIVFKLPRLGLSLSDIECMLRSMGFFATSPPSVKTPRKVMIATT